jgi:ATP-dependent RNA helicase DeaD
MAEGSVWFRAAIGRKKNAEARWLLPMICRRGGVDKHDIGAIRIMDTTTEFEISKEAAESFAVKIRRPDKEDNIRIEPMTGAPTGPPPREQRPDKPRRDDKESGRGVRHNDRPREGKGPKHHGKPHGMVVNESGSGFAQETGSRKKKRH